MLSTTEVGRGGSTNVLGGDDVLRSVRAGAASGQVPNDPGGVLRRMLRDDHGLGSLGVGAAERLRASAWAATHFDGEGTAWIDYAGPPRTVRTVSFSRLLDGKVPAAALQGQGRGGGPGRALAAGRAPHVVSRRRPDVGRRDPGQLGGHGARRVPARARRPAGVDVVLILLMGVVGPVVALRLGHLWAVVVGLGAARRVRGRGASSPSRPA